jgi:outer membrane protein OmpA-like peptidoglycan-associated protein
LNNVGVFVFINITTNFYSMRKNMKYISIIAVSAAIFSFNAFAESSNESTYDANNKFVIDSNEKCVRTKWMAAGDPCMPKMEPVAHAHASKDARTVLFAFDSAELKESAKAKLTSLAEVINASSKITKVSLVGYTDQFGSDDYNLDLSKRRVDAVAKFLGPIIRVAVAPEVVSMEGAGKAPTTGCMEIKARNERIECMAEQRRVEAVFKYEVEHAHAK